MHFLRFSVRLALQGLWRNRIMNIAATVTMILMLILLSALVIVISGVEAGLNYVESKLEELTEEANEISEKTKVPRDIRSRIKKVIEGSGDKMPWDRAIASVVSEISLLNQDD